MEITENIIRILISYHRYDIEWRDLFENGWKPFQDQGQLIVNYGEVTESSQIFPPEPQAFDFIILLISQKYLSLYDVIEKEIPEKILPLQEHGTRVIPVYVENCSWQSISWLREMNVWPSHQLPFSNMSENEKKRFVSRLIKDELKLGGAEIYDKNWDVGSEAQNFEPASFTDAYVNKGIEGESKLGDGWKDEDWKWKKELIENDSSEEELDEGSYGNKGSKEEGEQKPKSKDEDRIEQEAVKLEERDKLKFSLETKNIIKVAMQLAIHEGIDSWKLHTSDILVAIAYYGQRKEEKYNTAQFVLDKLRNKKNRDNLEDYFKRIDSGINLEKIQGKELYRTGYVGDTLRDAKKLAIRTTDQNIIQIRHLFAAILFFMETGKETPSAHNVVEEAGIGLPTFKREFQQYVKKTFKQDNAEAWEQIFIDLKQDDPKKKFTVSDFKSKLDIVGKEIFEKVVDIATSSNIKLYTDIPDENYINLRLKRSDKSDNVAIQIHRYGDDELRVALAVAGAKKGAEREDPELNDFIVRGNITELSGYKKGVGWERGWLNGNLPITGAREKAAVYVLKRDILVNIEAWNGVKELFEWAVENFDKLLSEEPGEAGGIEGEEEPFRPAAADFVGDEVRDKYGNLIDRLGIKNEINALSSLIALKDVAPPLSIGLFGDWGSGKSFFMEMMRQRISHIAKQSREHFKNNQESSYCRDIVQIHFNAWHYMDANLWASLVTHIFDKLAEHLSKGKEEDVEDKKRVIFSRIESAKRQCEEAEKKKEKANLQLNAAEEKNKEIIKNKEQAEKDLENVKLTDVLAIARKDKSLDVQYNKIAQLMGLREGVKQYEELEETVAQAEEMFGHIKLVWKDLFGRKGGALKLCVLVCLVLVLPILAGQIVSWLSESEALKNYSYLISGILSIAGGYAKSFRPGLKRISRGIKEWEKITEEIDKINTEKSRELSREEIELRDLIKDLEDQREQAGKEKKAAEKLIEEAQEELEEIKTGRRLHKFIVERSGKSEYRDKLGIISIIREDFDGLSKMITESKGDETLDELRRIDRIVLYIDDLDRCPSERVVEVLQAVHLILAFKLFVVVVGVDSRWVLHALNEQYTAFGGNSEKLDQRWVTTPQNYVEKIFQIPFALQRMENEGYKNLVGVLTKSEEGQADLKKPEIPVDDKNKGKNIEGVKTSVGKESVITKEKDEPEIDIEEIPETSFESREGKDFVKEADSNEMLQEMTIDMVPPALKLSEPEKTFMKALGDLIPTPRAAKRFVNIYKLICATLTDEEKVQKFKGENGEGGDYQTVLLLLAILTGYPDEACDIIKVLEDNTEKIEEISVFIQKLDTKIVEGSKPPIYKNIAREGITESEQVRWKKLCSILNEKMDEFNINDSLELFVKWASVVGRFCFQYGKTD